MLQPPCSNSSAPPGSSMTPSSVTYIDTTTFRIETYFVRPCISPTSVSAIFTIHALPLCVSGGHGDVGDHLEGLPGAPGEEDCGPLAGEGTDYRTADCPSCCVGHGVVALKQHFPPPLSLG